VVRFHPRAQLQRFRAEGLATAKPAIGIMASAVLEMLQGVAQSA
jgi:hypothetical protein